MCKKEILKHLYIIYGCLKYTYYEIGKNRNIILIVKIVFIQSAKK